MMTQQTDERDGKPRYQIDQPPDEIDAADTEPIEHAPERNGIEYFSPTIMGMSFMERRAVYAHINAQTPEALDAAIASLQKARAWMIGGAA